MPAVGTSLPTIAAIQRTVANHYSLPIETMRQYRGPDDTARKRQVAVALSVMLTDHSYHRIGQLFGGRDHSTMKSATRAVAKRRRTDPELDRSIKRITHELLRECGA